jgi:hypothetical protein
LIDDDPRTGEEDQAHTQMLGLQAACMIYPVDCPDDLPMAVQFAEQNPDSRWYVERRAAALGVNCIPESWSVTV